MCHKTSESNGGVGTVGEFDLVSYPSGTPLTGEAVTVVSHDVSCRHPLHEGLP